MSGVCEFPRGHVGLGGHGRRVLCLVGPVRPRYEVPNIAALPYTRSALSGPLFSVLFNNIALVGFFCPRLMESEKLKKEKEKNVT